MAATGCHASVPPAAATISGDGVSQEALQTIAAEGCGIVVMLGQAQSTEQVLDEATQFPEPPSLTGSTGSDGLLEPAAGRAPQELPQAQARAERRADEQCIAGAR